MKRILSLILCAVIFCCFCGCSEETEAVSLGSIYTANAVVVMDDNEYTLSMSRLGNGAWDFTYSSPASLEGMNISFEDSNVEITYKGLETVIPKEDMNTGAICEIISGILDNAAAGNDMRFFKKDGSIEAEGIFKECDYTIILDNETKQITGILCEDKNFEAAVSDFKKMQ